MLNTKRKKENILLSRVSGNVVISLRTASFVSDFLKEKGVSVKSLLVGIVLNTESLARRVIDQMKISEVDILDKVIGKRGIEITGNSSLSRDIVLTEDVKYVVDRAFLTAQKANHIYVGTEHLMLSLLGGNFRELKGLESLGLTYEKFQEALFKVAIYPVGFLPRGFDMQNEGGIIDFLGTDLVELAKLGQLDPVIGREEEIDQLVNILSRRKKNNPIILGQAGVGKTVLVEGLAQRIADGVVNPSLRDAKIVSLDVSTIMAGSKMRGDVEEKVMAIIDEIANSDNTILFIDEISSIVSPGIPGSSSDIASVLKPALTREDFRVIGATTTEEYSAYFESDNALARRFQPLYLEELSVLSTIKVLDKIRPILEDHHKVKIGDEAIKYSANLTDRYVADRYLPDKAIDALDEAAASKRLDVESDFADIQAMKNILRDMRGKKEKLITGGEMEEALRVQRKEEVILEKIGEREKKMKLAKMQKVNEINADDVREVISKWTGIPVNTLGSKEKNALLNLEKELKKQIIGQDEACSIVSNAIKRARTGIIDAGRPWASFLFLGPTGVGKTELAKVLTKELFGKEDNLVQVDMSEMMEMHSVSKLIGSPPGYVGFQEGGWLTEKVRRHPHSVILFDEVEKAHPEVLNVLLQILEYGHLTDGRGRRVNFKNTVIILTSNIGAEEIRKDRVLGFGAKDSRGERKDTEIDSAYNSMKQTLLGELQNTLRPELLNRLDDMVIFRSLTRRDARKIVGLLVENLNRRLEEENMRVKLDSKAVGYIAKEAFSEEYGARPLRRFVQDSVENLLAEYILTHGDGTKSKKIVELNVVLEDGKLVILEDKE